MIQQLAHFDYHKPSDEIFVDLIYYTNGIRLPLDKLTIEELTVSHLENGEYIHNTSVLVKGRGNGNRDLKGGRPLF